MSVEVWADGQNLGTCRGCGARIKWAITLKNRRMPLEASAKPSLSTYDPAIRRTTEIYDAKDTHWAQCPEAKRFK